MGAALACLQALVGLALAIGALLLARCQERAEADGVAEASVRQTRSAVRGATGLGLLAAVIILAPLVWLMVLALRSGPGMTVWATLWDSLESVWAQDFGNAI